MGCDMVLALGTATVEGRTLFGQNRLRPTSTGQALHRSVGRCYALGEKVQTQNLDIPQARETFSAVGTQPRGLWGYDAGLNQHGVTVGCAALPRAIRAGGDGLLGSDLVRLTLERSRSARQGVEILTDLIRTHGQSGGHDPADQENDSDNSFVVADQREGFVLEAAGSFWVYQEVQQVRAVSNVRVIRQDWDRISPGLSGHAIAQGWWPNDGRKLDFAGALGDDSFGLDFGLRRWGRTTLLLEQQNGRIDSSFLRYVLSEIYELGLDEARPDSEHSMAMADPHAFASMLVDLGADASRLVPAWVTFAPLCGLLYLPVFPEGELPVPLTNIRGENGRGSFWNRLSGLSSFAVANPNRWEKASGALGRLQVQIENDTAEFAVEGGQLRSSRQTKELERQTSLFAEHCLDLVDASLAEILGERPRQERETHKIAEESETIWV